MNNNNDKFHLIKYVQDSIWEKTDFKCYNFNKKLVFRDTKKLGIVSPSEFNNNVN